jgi:hypothetical protein
VRGAGATPQALLGVVVAQDRGIPSPLAPSRTSTPACASFVRTAADSQTAVLLGISRSRTATR